MKEPDFHQNFNLFFDELGLSRPHINRTEQIGLQPSIGKGAIHRFVPRFDIDLVLSEYTFHQNHAIRLSTESAMVELSYCLEGTREVSIGGKCHEFVPGSCNLQFMNQGEVHFDFGGNQPFHMVGIGIPVATFHHFMEEAGGVRSVDFSQLLGSQAFRIFQERITPVSSVILKQMIQSARTIGTINLEMECHILELLSLAFGSFLADNTSKPTTLSKSDMSKIQQARAIILERMTEPPTLMELSRMIGLNDYKLKIGFKEMYGSTVFGFLRDQRLEKAFHLLQQGQLNVNETSCAVGYSNSSYFAEAFREKYGINPGEFVRCSNPLL